MTQEAQRIAIAKACGWTDNDVQGEYCFGTEPARSELDARQFMMEVPYYCHDLNAMHEAEKVLTKPQKHDYNRELIKICTGYGVMEFLSSAMSATASQRAEAFLRTLNLWRDDA